MTIKDVSFKKALRDLSKIREIIKPNKGFKKQLEEYEKSDLLKQVIISQLNYISQLIKKFNI